MDLDGIERASLRTLGGSDTVTVNDLTGTEIGRRRRRPSARRRRPAGHGDRPRAPRVTTPSWPAHAGITGVGARTQRHRRRRDRRRVRAGRAGRRRHDHERRSSALGPAVVTVDGGAGADTLRYTGTAGDDLIPLVANGAVATVVDRHRADRRARRGHRGARRPRRRGPGLRRRQPRRAHAHHDGRRLRRRHAPRRQRRRHADRRHRRRRRRRQPGRRHGAARLRQRPLHVGPGRRQRHGRGPDRHRRARLQRQRHRRDRSRRRPTASACASRATSPTSSWTSPASRCSPRACAAGPTPSRSTTSRAPTSTSVEVDLSAFADGGAGDGQPDVVTARGTDGADAIKVDADGRDRRAARGRACTGGADATGDVLGVAALGEADTIATGIGIPGTAAVHIDGGDGADVDALLGHRRRRPDPGGRPTARSRPSRRRAALSSTRSRSRT